MRERTLKTKKIPKVFEEANEEFQLWVNRLASHKDKMTEKEYEDLKMTLACAYEVQIANIVENEEERINDAIHSANGTDGKKWLIREADVSTIVTIYEYKDEEGYLIKPHIPVKYSFLTEGGTLDFDDIDKKLSKYEEEEEESELCPQEMYQKIYLATLDMIEDTWSEKERKYYDSLFN